MSDEQIAEYLRSRASVQPPMDLVASIGDAIQAVPQRRHSWFAPFVPAAAAVAAAAVVLVAAILVGQEPDAGPPPSRSPSEAPATPTSEPSPSPSPVPSLLEPGDTVTIDAVDPNGPWGSITLFRGGDVGGYGDGSVSEEAFVVQVHVTYVADENPDPPEFGAADWGVRAASGGDVRIRKLLAPRGPRALDGPTLGTYPGAVDIFTTPLVGWLLFEIPRDLADDQLEVIYQPRDFDEPAASFALRDPAPAPNPVPEQNVGPAPAPATYVEKDGYPFSVIDHAEADALFETPDTCTNPEAGYTVTFPDDWYTNTAIGETPACSWFTPNFFEVVDPAQTPDEIWISIRMVDGIVAYTSLTQVFLAEEVLLGGLTARRAESNFRPNDRPDYRAYDYHVSMGSQDQGPSFLASIDSDSAGDYELGKAVLDRMMASLEFEEAP